MNNPAPESNSSGSHELVKQQLSHIEKRIDDSRSYLNIIVAALSGVLATAAVTGGVWGIIFRQDWSEHTARISELSRRTEDLQSSILEKVDQRVQSAIKGEVAPDFKILTPDGRPIDGQKIQTIPMAWARERRITWECRLQNDGGQVARPIFLKYLLDENIGTELTTDYFYPSNNDEFPYETGGPYGRDWMGTTEFPGGGFNISSKLSITVGKAGERPTKPIKMKIQAYAGSLKLFESTVTLLFDERI